MTSAFPHIAELRRAIEFNRLWTLESDSAGGLKVVAAAHYTAMLHAAGTRMSQLDLHNQDLQPPFPRHDALVLEFVTDESGSRTWTMTWREAPASRCFGPMSAGSLRELFTRALEISAWNARATLDAFVHLTAAR